MTVNGWTEGEWSIMDMIGRDDATEAVVAEGMRIGAMPQCVRTVPTIDA